MSRSRGGSPVTTRSSIRISPLVTGSSPADHPKGGRLAAAGGADEHQELARLDLEAEVVDRQHAAGEALGDVLEADRAAGLAHEDPASIPVMRLFRTRASSAGGISASTPAAATIG